MSLWAGRAQLSILLPVSPARVTHVAAVTGKGWKVPGDLMYLFG